MIKLIEGNCDEVIAELKNVVDYAYQKFESTELTSYAGINDKGLINLVLQSENRCIYLRNVGDKITSYYFTVNDTNDLDCYLTNDYEVYIKDNVIMFVNRDNALQLSLKYVKYDKESDDGYDGFLSYLQYNNENDTHIEIQIPYNYRELNGRQHIYPYNLDNFAYVFIDKNFKKKKPLEVGVNLNREYFARFELDDDTIGYAEQQYKDYLLKGETEGDRSIVKYYRIKVIAPDGNYVTFFPFGRDYNEDDILNLVKEYGFLTKIPQCSIDIFNGSDEVFEEIKSICGQIKELNNENVDNFKLIMQIVPDNE